MIEPVKLAYAAGLFDGEGCITCLWPKRKQVRMEINMVHRPTLIKFTECIGMGEVKNAYENRSGRRARWRWRVVDRKAIEALRLLIPYLCEKKEQAQAAVCFKEVITDCERDLLKEKINSLKHIEFS